MALRDVDIMDRHPSHPELEATRSRSTTDAATIATLPVTALGRQVGHLLPAQELALTDAVVAAFDLD